MADLDQTQAIIGQHCLAIMDSISNEEIKKALRRFHRQAGRTARILEEHGYRPKDSASLMLALLLTSWELGAPGDG